MKIGMKIKIRNFLFLFLFFSIILPSSIAALFTHFFVRHTIQKEFTANYIESISSEIKTNFSLLVFRLNNAYLQLMTSRELYDINQAPSTDPVQRDAALHSVFYELLNRTSTVSIIDFVDTSGNLYRFGADISDFAAPDGPFLSSLSRHQFLFSEDIVHLGDSSFNAIGRTLYNYSTNTELGTVVFYIDESNLSSLYSISPDENCLFFISSDDIIIFHPDRTYIGSKPYIPSQLLPDPQKNPAARPGYIYMEYSLENPSIQNSLKITCILSNQAISQKMNRLLLTLLVSYLLILLFAFILATCLSSRLSRHLTGLKNAMEHFDLEHDTEIYRNPSNEIAALEISFDKMADEIRTLVADIRQEKEKQRIAEIRTLQSQINPHFIYNALDSISWKAKENHQYEIDDMVVTLATFFRIGLHKGADMIPISQELEHVKSYLEIEAIRFPDLFQTTWEIEEDTYCCLTPKIILQPIVENCIKHGFKEIHQGGKILIRNYISGNDIYFEISDNGKGMELNNDSLPSSSSKEGGYGLYNINERLTRYFGEEYRLRVISQPGTGTTVRLRIKYQRAEEALT
ncbi:MAG TPA: sensor histidine kinase [Candidatus Eisenbergiella merdipullorum]|uniref:Sensor histidine kinase n=1 Tax=Candidatus Eisenbergiella merdipullorum TaxID=2838553 RepID=A0A9D2I9F2_9FIRM|nr:sensor histidine kinase [Candidatus Eisenbergiella merdipullorum]